ncbi:hypothetical protein Poli38472_013223 [Pythium oligandrum]|uniref:Choline transporter-like protein n=1 Tax=Pythium oligandrum TaxID=41045 RepID=A0A8K1C386_PYTOL|nr:hypothetical protein Poli38472_013223 [Pythium oligandrum]|eukprot:TMW55332.1 hypothetical protein Poli38472_013223 [Pythium oligandrum]
MPPAFSPTQRSSGRSNASNASTPDTLRGFYGASHPSSARTQPHLDEEDDDEDIDSDDLDDLEARTPLISSTGSAGPTSSAISPSTGSGSVLAGRNFRGPKSKRHCTDTWALVLFAAYWLGMIVLAVYSFTRKSNVEFAKYIKDGVDFQGQACAENQSVYFPDYRVNPDFGVCVTACPARDGEDLVVALPLADGKLQANGSRALTTVRFKTYATHAWAYVCAPANVQTEQVMISQLQDTVGRFVGALGESWPVMVISCGISLGTAALYLVFLKYCGCFTIFLTTISIESLLVYGSYRLLQASADPFSYPNDPAMKSSLQIAAVIVSCAAVLFLLLAFNMLPRLMLAGNFITHASKTLGQLKKLLIMPFLSYMMLILLFWWSILVTICIFGAGETSTRVANVAASSPSVIQIETESFQVNYQLRWFFVYHLWGMYWTAMWIISMGDMITATAVSMWYFSPDDRVTSLKRMNPRRDPVSYAVRSTFRYHLGTLAVSAATVSPVGYVRIFFAYLEDKNEYDSNFVTETLAKCCCCCMWCFNSCLKFICKEANYITAIQGTNFYSSGRLAHTLISSNLLRIGALNQIGYASVLLGKLIVCSTTCFVAWFMLNDVSSPVLPLIAIIVFSYGVAHAFMTIYETTINMLLMCFTLDENMHGGRGNTAFAHATLVRSVNDHLRPKWQTAL